MVNCSLNTFRMGDVMEPVSSAYPPAVTGQARPARQVSPFNNSKCSVPALLWTEIDHHLHSLFQVAINQGREESGDDECREMEGK